MAYLEGKNIIHRDLACRNLLCKEESEILIVKISDFGLSREIEDFYESQDGNLPIKWTAPEVFKTSKHTIKSDVWAYGITIWEIFSFGEVPYSDLDNSLTREKVSNGFRLPKPSECPNIIYQLMLDCWKENPNERPSFRDITLRLKEIIHQLFPDEYDKPPELKQTIPQFGQAPEENVIYN